jgi:hypothetical protein
MIKHTQTHLVTKQIQTPIKINLHENIKLIERMNEIDSSKISEVDKITLRDIETNIHNQISNNLDF